LNYFSFLILSFFQFLVLLSATELLLFHFSVFRCLLEFSSAHWLPWCSGQMSKGIFTVSINILGSYHSHTWIKFTCIFHRRTFRCSWLMFKTLIILTTQGIIKILLYWRILMLKWLIIILHFKILRLKIFLLCKIIYFFKWFWLSCLAMFSCSRGCARTMKQFSILIHFTYRLILFIWNS
jgi:hypothetical protein